MTCIGFEGLNWDDIGFKNACRSALTTITLS